MISVAITENSTDSICLELKQISDTHKFKIFEKCEEEIIKRYLHFTIEVFEKFDIAYFSIFLLNIW